MRKHLQYTCALILGYTALHAQDAYLVEAEDFQFKGGWQTEQKMLRVFSGKTAAADALTVIKLNRAGNYNVWVKAADYPHDKPGTRLFRLLVNEQAMEESGKHGHEGFFWEKAGTIQLDTDETVLRLQDTRRNFGRCDAIMFTIADADPNKTDLHAVKARTILKTATSSTAAASEAASVSPQAKVMAAIGNEKIRLQFVESTDKKIVSLAAIRKSGEWITTDATHEANRIFLLWSAEPQISFGSFFPSWRGSSGTSSFTSRGKTFTMQEASQLLNPFFSGQLLACTAVNVQKINDHTLAVQYKTADGQTITGNWQLQAQHLQLTLQYTPAQNGYYSFAVTALQGTAPDNVTNIQVPPMFQYHRFPEGPVMVPSAMMPQPLAIMETSDLTTYITAAPATYPLDWAEAFTSRAGFAIRNEHNAAQPVAFAPVLGLADSKMAAGKTFSRAFIIGAVSTSWQDALAYISDSIFQVRDYRQQQNVSLTEAAFNIIDLIKNDAAAGWDPALKGFYDIEADPRLRPTVVQAAPLAVISAAVLGKDEDLYIRRALPTIEYTLSRSGFRWANGVAGTAFNKDKKSLLFSPFGSQFTTAYYEGVYQLLQEANPWLKKIALPDNALRPAKGYSVVVPVWTQALAAYRLTKDKSWLDAAMRGADTFLTKEVYGHPVTPLSKVPFYNTSFYANWWELPDLYETTGNNAYLKAAEAAAFQTIAGIRSYPVIENKSQLIHPHNEYTGNTTMWWKGGVKYRLGFPRTPGDVQEKQVPQSLVSPVGLGFEQPFTFFDPGKLVRHVFMSSWAPHLLRLFQYDHRSIFETYARNAVIGRFTNYPGYYATGFTDITLQPDFPYKGPDVSSIYYHHIPPHLAFTLDYLVTNAIQRSAGKVQFPYSKQDGFVWFNNRIYGGGKGQVMDDKEVSLWMKKGLIQVDNPAINYLTAISAKNFWVILTNEAQTPQTGSITLGKDAPVQGSKQVRLDAKGFTAIAFPLTGKNVAKKITPVKDGMQVIDMGAGIGRFYAFRIRSPFGWDSIFGFLESLQPDGTTVTVTINQTEEMKTAYPFEWSFHPLGMQDNAVIKVMIHTKGKTTEKEIVF